MKKLKNYIKVRILWIIAIIVFSEFFLLYKLYRFNKKIQILNSQIILNEKNNFKYNNIVDGLSYLKDKPKRNYNKKSITLIAVFKKNYDIRATIEGIKKINELYDNFKDFIKIFNKTNLRRIFIFS